MLKLLIFRCTRCSETGAHSDHFILHINIEGRERRETAAIAYLSEHEDVDRPVRFDDVSLVVFGEGKAFLRHHINALSDAIPDIAPLGVA